MPNNMEETVEKSARCKAVLFPKRFFRTVEEKSRRLFGYSAIVVADDGKLIAVS